jgi:phthiodiolone/phenolphthiodiolone dimycocerosates ketoreductase
MKEFFLTGTARDVVYQAARWRDHGLRYLVVMNLSILQPSLRNGLAANASVVMILRMLKKL